MQIHDNTRSDEFMPNAPLPAFGPIYPPMPRLNKFRAAANGAGGVMNLEKALRQAYGAAVEEEILALQRLAARGAAVSLPAPRCASGSWANTAEGIEAAVRGRHARENAVASRRAREGRSDAEVQELYDAAMTAKRGAR